MSEVLGLLWLRPWWLLALPAVLGAGALLLARRPRLGGWEAAIDPELLARLRAMGRVREGGRGWNLAPLAILAVTILALAGPAGERRDRPSYRNLDGVLLVLDLSASITEADRLLDMGTVARLVAARAGTRQTGLIVYAGDAFLASPGTTDARALGGTIALLDGETVPVVGSRPDRALALAEATIREAGLIATDVVWFTDGGGAGAETADAIRALGRAGATVSTIHVPTEPAGGTADAEGQARLTSLAALGGGAVGSLAAPGPVLAHVDGAASTRIVETGFGMLLYEDLGRILLALALLPALFLLPRRSPGRRP